MTTKICIRDGCDKPIKSKGLCSSHYYLGWKYGREEKIMFFRPAEFHGLSKSSDYYTYVNMLGRCNDKKNVKYLRYGGRGIKVCPRWATSFVNFIEDMGRKPPGLQLDRIDNDGDYTKENCRWVTNAENCQNRQKTKLTPEDVKYIRNSKETTRELCAKFGICDVNVLAVKTRKTWKNVD